MYDSNRHHEVAVAKWRDPAGQAQHGDPAAQIYLTQYSAPHINRLRQVFVDTYVSGSFRCKVTADSVSAVDDRHTALLGYSSNVTSNRKIDKSGVSGKSISGKIDTKFE